MPLTDILAQLLVDLDSGVVDPLLAGLIAIT